MNVLDQIQNVVVAPTYDRDGRLHKRLPFPGHDVQITHWRGEEWWTVFCDGDCAELTAGQVEDWIEARLRR